LHLRGGTGDAGLDEDVFLDGVGDDRAASVVLAGNFAATLRCVDPEFEA
jgi:hypothetical protein